MPKVVVVVTSARVEFSRWIVEKVKAKFGEEYDRAELSKKGDISQPTLQSLFHGERHPTERSVEKIARILEMDPLELKRRAGILPLLDTSHPVGITAEEKEIVATALRDALARL
jgi:hypothetical protein